VSGRLTRRAAALGPAAPVRVVHLGLGGFHRAHQAWYTAYDPDWGIAAYSFTSTAVPEALAAQDGLFTLVTRGAGPPEAELITSLSRAHPGADTERWLTDLASPEVAVLTLTVTEAAYQVPEPGHDAALNRIVAGLRRRRRDSGAPLAIVPCDNVPDNGAVLRRALLETAERTDPQLASWIEGSVAVASTVVDRITPATTQSDVDTARQLTGFADAAPAVTEPFTEWLLAGDFPLGRPAWERGGAQFAADADELAQYQQRKLWLLNGSHSLLAYAGLARQRDTVDEAIADPALSELVESWWDVAAAHSQLPAEHLDQYRQHLRSRYANPSIRHHLRQIGKDGSQKIPARILPVLRAERERGRLPRAAVAVLAAWIRYLQREPVHDPRADEFTALATSDSPVRGVLRGLDPALARDGELVTEVHRERLTFG
jgi:fructuronate reductase